MRNNVNLIRWVLIVPICTLGWYIALLLGLSAHKLLETFCPAEQIVSGLCVSPLFGVAERFNIILFSGVSAAFVVFLAFLVAPSHKKNVAMTALKLGAIVATYVFVQTGAWAEYVSALVCGIFVVCWLRTTRYWRSA